MPYESKTWLTKAHKRNLISDNDYALFQSEIKIIGIKLNNYIKSIGNTKINTVDSGGSSNTFNNAFCASCVMKSVLTIKHCF